MIKLLQLLFLVLLTTNVLALDESTVLSEMKSIILDDKKCSDDSNKILWSVKTVKTEIHTTGYWTKGEYFLKYSKFGCDLGENGTIVMAPGRTESSLEFYETAIDFIKKGFSPVYVVDHVGQGFSPRLLDDPRKGHIYRFSDYVDAFDSAVEDIKLDVKQLAGVNTPNLYFLSNSMGGAIGLGYFQKTGSANPFKAAALLGPMIRVNYLGFPTGDVNHPNGVTHPTDFQKKKFSEFGVIKQAQVFCKIPGIGCKAYATKGARATAETSVDGTAYVVGNRDFATAWELAPEQVMTHSRNRYDLKTFLWESEEMTALYEELELESPKIAAPTYQWAKQTARFNRAMRKKRNVRKMSAMPLKIITGEKDARAYTPYENGSTDLSEHVKFCATVNLVKGEGACDFLQIDNAFHELHKESREFREPALDAAVEHFLKN